MCDTASPTPGLEINRVKTNFGKHLLTSTQNPGSSHLPDRCTCVALLRKLNCFASKMLSVEDQDTSHGMGLEIYKQIPILVSINHALAEKGIMKSCMNNMNYNHLLKALCAPIPEKSN